MDLSALFQPRSVALIGASDSPTGHLVTDTMRASGYQGKVYFVNPRRETVLGERCYPAVADLPETPDCALVQVPSGSVPGVLEECGRSGVPAAMVHSVGFADTGAPEGIELQRTVQRICHEHSIALCGPNCMGLVNFGMRMAAYWFPLSPSMQQAPAGSIGLISNSGAIVTACFNLAGRRGIGYRYLVSSGNEAVLSSVDYIDYFLQDPECTVIATMLDTIRAPDRFADAARRATDAGKPIVVLKVGKSEAGRRTAAAHTGGLAGSYEAVSAWFRQLGIVEVESLLELNETASLFAQSGQVARRNRVFCASPSGGATGLASDAGELRGIDFVQPSEELSQRIGDALPGYVAPRNPLDLGGMDHEVIASVVKSAVASGEYDVVTLVLPTGGPRNGPGVRELTRFARSNDVLFVTIVSQPEGQEDFWRELTIDPDSVLLRDIHIGFRAIAAMVHRSQPVWRPSGAPTHQDRTTASAIVSDHWLAELGRHPRGLPEGLSRRWMEEFGFRATRQREVSSATDAVAAARELGYPVVAKTTRPDILHKTELGAVHVGLAADDAVREAYDNIVRATDFPGVRIDEQVMGGIEVILGLVRDELVGPMLVLGAGGVLTELVRDKALYVPPISREEALEMIKSTRLYALLSAHRGGPRYDVEALADAVLKMSNFALANRDLIEAVDINPLFVLPEGQGVVMADALVIPSDHALSVGGAASGAGRSG